MELSGTTPHTVSDLLSDAATQDPHRYFAEFRATGPIHFNETHQMWIATTYDLCEQLLSSDELSSDTFSPFYAGLPAEARLKWRPMKETLTEWLSFMDPPSHLRIRRLVSSAFTPRVVRAIAPTIRQLCASMLEEELARGEPFDVRDRIAYPLPANVVALMLGVPAAELWLVRQWAEDIVRVTLGGESTDRFQRAQTALLEFREYLRPILQNRRIEPRPDDLLSAMMTTEATSGRLTESEVISTAILLLLAGHETTQNLILSAVVHLYGSPKQLKLLVAAPDLAANAVEEVLRFDGPVKGRIRHATVPFETGGQRIAASDSVYIAIASANRDPSRFTNADRFDIRRDDTKHLAFGYGIHFCLGASLARLETRIFLEELLRVADRIHVDLDNVTYEPALVMRGPRGLVVSPLDATHP